MHRALGTAAAGRDRLTPCPRPHGPTFDRGHALGFAAVWFVTSSKNGVSAKGLQDALGFGSYETAWAWLHKPAGPWSAPTGARIAPEDCSSTDSFNKPSIPTLTPSRI